MAMIDLKKYVRDECALLFILCKKMDKGKMYLSGLFFSVNMF